MQAPNSNSLETKTVLAFATAPIALPTSTTAPDWVMLFPADDVIEAVDGRRFTLNMAYILAHFEKMGRTLPFDLEHATELKGPKGDPAPAVGWMTQLEDRSGALWAKVEWTNQGRELIETKAYRYLSPAFGAIEGENGAPDLVLMMQSAGLTNNPALQLPMLARSKSQTSNTKETEMDLAKLREALGLPKDADETAIVQACRDQGAKLKTEIARAEAAEAARATPDATKFVPVETYQTTLARAETAEAKITAAEKAAKDAEVSTVIEAGLKAGKITPATKDFYTAACHAQGVDAVKDLLKIAPEVGGPSKASEKKPGAATEPALDGVQTEVARALGLEGDALKTFTARANEETV